MAIHHPKLIEALRETANRLVDGAHYEWGHMGRCNCGHLVQTVTELSDCDIARSLDFELDEWSEYAHDYCEGTGERVDDLFLTLRNIGFGTGDVIELENLTNPEVLKRLSNGSPRHLRRNDVSDVVLYMRTLADLLEESATGIACAV